MSNIFIALGASYLAVSLVLAPCSLRARFDSTYRGCAHFRDARGHGARVDVLEVEERGARLEDCGQRREAGHSCLSSIHSSCSSCSRWYLFSLYDVVELSDWRFVHLFLHYCNNLDGLWSRFVCEFVLLVPSACAFRKENQRETSSVVA